MIIPTFNNYCTADYCARINFEMRLNILSRQEKKRKRKEVSAEGRIRRISRTTAMVSENDAVGSLLVVVVVAMAVD